MAQKDNENRWEGCRVLWPPKPPAWPGHMASLDPGPGIADGVGLGPASCQVQGPLSPSVFSFGSGRSQHFSTGLHPLETAGVPVPDPTWAPTPNLGLLLATSLPPPCREQQGITL